MYKWSTEGISFSSKAVLGPVELTINTGDTHVIIGPSGSGKTTLLNALAGFVESVNGKWLSKKPSIGYLFQEPRLLPWRTIKQNLLLVQPNETRVDELLNAVQLQEYSDYFPSQISLGMARRAALARCLLLEPDVVLMDEPLASLDSVTAKEMRRLIKDLICKDQHRSLVYVTHDLDEAVEMANQLSIVGGKPACIQRSFDRTQLNEAQLDKSQLEAWLNQQT